MEKSDLVTVRDDLVTVPLKRGRGNPNWIRKHPKVEKDPFAKPRWQDPTTRGRYLLEKFGVDEILAFGKKIADSKPVPLSTQDAQLVAQIARSLNDGTELERFQNRTFGKVPDKQISLNVNLETSPEKLSERALALLDNLTD